MEDQQEQYFDFKLVHNRLHDKRNRHTLSLMARSLVENIFENVPLACWT